jgi:hypothetical protein
MDMRDPDRRLSHSQEKQILKAAADIARTEYPSAQRADCPTSGELQLLARRRSPLADSPHIVDHIGTCSQCFIEYSQYRVAHKRRLAYAITASLAVAGTLVLISHSLQRLGPTHNQVPRAVAPLPELTKQTANFVLDLRHEGLTRGAGPLRPQYVTPRFPRVNLSISIYLPIGSDDGAYDVVLIRNSGEPLVRITGTAKFTNQIVILPVSLDLTNIAPGLYYLYLRHARSEWRTYPVLLE